MLVLKRIYLRYQYVHTPLRYMHTPLLGILMGLGRARVCMYKYRNGVCMYRASTGVGCACTDSVYLRVYLLECDIFAT